jgi:hypothetical protein
MTPVIIAALVFGWIALSVVVCLAVCMASSRFSARLEQQEAERKLGLFRRAQLRRAHRRAVDDIQSGIRTVRVKSG